MSEVEEKPKNAMDEAAADFEKELKALIAESEENKLRAAPLVELMRKYKSTAGYKRMCKIVFDHL